MMHISPRLEIRGANLLGIIGSLNETSVAPIRKKYGFDTIDPNGWYSAQKLAAFFDDLEQNGGLFDLVAVGMNIAKHAPFPPEVNTMQKAIEMLNSFHQSSWRGGDAGRFEYDMLGDRHFRVYAVNVPLPPDLLYGMSYGTAKRFAPSSHEIRVEREVQGDSYIFDTRW